MTLKELDRKYIWHPTTPQIGAEFLNIISAKGSLLYEESGKVYIDAISSWWVTNHGHAHPKIAQAISEQAAKLEQVIFANCTHEPAVLLAQQIIELLGPPFEKVFFSDNGSTGIEVALKLLIQYYYNQGMQRNQFIALKYAYHGDTFGAMSVTIRSYVNEPFEPLFFKVQSIDIPSELNIQEVIADLERLSKTEDIAGLILEPLVLGAGGMKMYAAELLDQLIAKAHELGIMVIADEVMTGFGRTGTMFAINQIKNKPDIICLSKGLTGGFLPLALTVCTGEIYNAFYQEGRKKTFFHGHSFTANPIACSAANASLALFKEEATWININRIIAQHQQFLGELNANPLVHNPRTKGTILAFELESLYHDYFNKLSRHITQFCLKKGVLLRPLGNTIYILPPYCISREELEQVYDSIRHGLACNWGESF